MGSEGRYSHRDSCVGFQWWEELKKKEDMSMAIRMAWWEKRTMGRRVGWLLSAVNLGVT